MIAASAPSRTIGASFETRCEPSVAKKAIASARFVLPWPLRPDEHIRTGTQRDIGDRIVAEVDEAELLHDHCATLVRRPDLGPESARTSAKSGLDHVGEVRLAPEPPRLFEARCVRAGEDPLEERPEERER